MNTLENRFLAVLILLIVGMTIATGQGKKTIREKQIVTVTVEEYFLDEGMKEPVVESVEKFNEDGELIELQEFNKRGVVKKWEKYLYDEEGQLVEEQYLDEKGRITRTEKNIYREDLRVEKHFFDGKGRLYKKKVYLYEYRK